MLAECEKREPRKILLCFALIVILVWQQCRSFLARSRGPRAPCPPSFVCFSLDRGGRGRPALLHSLVYMDFSFTVMRFVVGKSVERAVWGADFPRGNSAAEDCVCVYILESISASNKAMRTEHHL